MRYSRLLPILLAATTFAAESNLSKPGLDQLPPQQFDRLLRKGLDIDAANRHQLLNLAKEQAVQLSRNSECAIPLLEYHVKHPERYTLRTLHTGRSPDTTMAAPAMPVCRQ